MRCTTTMVTARLRMFLKTPELKRLRGVMVSRRCPLILTTTAGQMFMSHVIQQRTFTEIGKTAGVAFNEEGSMQAGMGLSADDFAHDGHQDIVKTNFSDDTPT